LTKTLKEYIAVKNVQQVKADFHPIKSVTKKEYRYYINTGEHNLFTKKYNWEYNLPLNPLKLNNILAVFQGKNDFFNFAYCRQKDRTKTLTTRTIEKIRC
jgi:tRNA pseudouridine(38-40) synthase